MTPPIEQPECHGALSWLQRQLDGAMQPMPEAVTAHIRSCEQCRGRIRAGELLLKSLAEKPTLPRLPAERIVLAVQRDRRQQRIGRWVAATASLAAALVLGVWLWTRPAPAPQAPVMAKAPSLREDAAEATDALVAIGKRATAETLGETSLLVPKMELPSAAVSALASAAAPMNNPGKGLIGGLEPVASSARRAIGMFMRDSGDSKVN